MFSSRPVASTLSILFVLTLAVKVPAEDCGEVPELPDPVNYPSSYTCRLDQACADPVYVAGTGTLVECRYCVSPNVRTVCMTGGGSPPAGQVCQQYFEDSGCGELVHSPATLVLNQATQQWEVVCDFGVIIEKDFCCHRALCRYVQDPLGN